MIQTQKAFLSSSDLSPEAGDAESCITDVGDAIEVCDGFMDEILNNLVRDTRGQRISSFHDPVNLPSLFKTAVCTSRWPFCAAFMRAFSPPWKLP